ncbi:hypothetical protein B0H14DRAFT_3463163 [Mycena olivaceomarginata]|nr:hypothetical protein B0H14DRAFT_3463163 [Mycena olivaceomarginata]
MLTSHFKLGHYMKIPPQPMFWSQRLCAEPPKATQWLFWHALLGGYLIWWLIPVAASC